jgi:glycosyltransferase involved in cell wall biosynthesis
MKVSVIIPTYYRQKDLAELFGSLLIQTYKPLEIIIVDDTPTEDIKKLCDVYKGKFTELGIILVYYRNTEKRSAAVARNIGAIKASGSIYLFLDSDVILFPDYIEKILDVFNLYPHAVAVQGWIINHSRKRHHYMRQIIYKIFRMSHYTKDSCRLSEYPSLLTRVINCECLSSSNFAVKCEIFDEFKFDENLEGYSYMEDLLFSHSVFKKYKNCFVV